MCVVDLDACMFYSAALQVLCYFLLFLSGAFIGPGGGDVLLKSPPSRLVLKAAEGRLDAMGAQSWDLYGRYWY